MELIDITQFKPLSIDSNGIETWDGKEIRLKEMAEKINDIIIKIKSEIHPNF